MYDVGPYLKEKESPMGEHKPGEYNTAEESDTEGQVKRRDVTDEGGSGGSEDLRRRDIVDEESDTEGQLKRRDMPGEAPSGGEDLRRRDATGDEDFDTEGQLK